jgi:hypothetical protein
VLLNGPGEPANGITERPGLGSLLSRGGSRSGVEIFLNFAPSRRLPPLQHRYTPVDCEMASDLEPFPPLQGSGPYARKENQQTHGEVRRRKSSALRDELPGDSEVAAFATLRSPPLTPTEQSV